MKVYLDMVTNQPHQSGRHFLQIPGPTNVPDRILRAIDGATIDHRGPAFERLAMRILSGIKPIFQTSDPVLIYTATGTGAWEAALVNTLNPGDRVLMAETGQFSTLWRSLANNLGLDVQFLPGDWRHGVRATDIADALAKDTDYLIKAVCCVHNETSTGVTSDITAVRNVMDELRHPALLMVDTISSLASIDYKHDEWGVDVSIGGSQKGLMLPPGLSFNAISNKALQIHETAKMNRSYWDWTAMLAANKNGAFPYTPATNLLYGLDEAITILQEEGLENVFRRHARLAEATRRAVAAWGLETVAQVHSEASNSLTAVMLPDVHNADAFRAIVLERFNMSLGNGLGRLAGKVFRIGHLGAFNELMLAGTLSGVEMGLSAAGIPHEKGGVQAALDYLSSS